MLSGAEAQELAQSIRALTQKLKQSDAEVYRDKSANISHSVVQKFPLDNATTPSRPLAEILFDFKSFTVTFANDDQTAYIDIILGNVNGSKAIHRFKNNSSYEGDFQISELTIFSGAQAGKSVTIEIFRDGIKRTGSLINQGNTKIIPANAFSVSNPTLSSGVATKIIVSDSATIRQNLKSSHTDSIFLGPDNTVAVSGATKGYELLPGDFMKFDNTAEVWAISATAVGAGALTITKET